MFARTDKQYLIRRKQRDNPGRFLSLSGLVVLFDKLELEHQLFNKKRSITAITPPIGVKNVITTFDLSLKIK